MTVTWLSRHQRRIKRKKELRAIGDALEAERYEEAIGLLEQLLLSGDSDRSAYQQYIMTSRILSKLPEAEQFLVMLDGQCQDNPNPSNYSAATFYLQGKVMEAKALWEQTIQAYPHYAPAFSNLGALYMHLGKYDQALLQFRVAIQLEPESSLSAYNNIGEIYMAKGCYQEAITYLQQALKMPGDPETVLANLGHCLLALGHDDQAIAKYEECLCCRESFTVNDSKAEVYVNLVRLYLQRHEPQMALDRCLEGIGIIPQNAALWAALGQVYLVQKQYDDATASLRKSIAMSPMSPRNLLVHRSLALAYFQQGKFGKATAEYRRALSWHPDFLKGEPTDADCSAEEELQRCREALSNGASSEQYLKLANSYLSLGDLDEAIVAYEEAIKLDPECMDAFIGLGTVNFAMDQHIHAIRYFSKTLEVDSQCVEGHLGLGLTYLSQGSVDMALIKLKWAVSISPVNPRAYNFLGRAYEIKTDYQRAEACYRKALFLAPGYAQAHNNLGHIFLATGKQHEAVAEFQAALDIYPDYVPALCYLGQAYLGLGDSQKALKTWREALKINPNNPLAEQYLEELDGREISHG